MCQNEIMLDSTLETLKIASESTSTIAIFNPAPAPEDGQLPAAIYSLTDIFVVRNSRFQSPPTHASRACMCVHVLELFESL